MRDPDTWMWIAAPSSAHPFDRPVHRLAEKPTVRDSDARCQMPDAGCRMPDGRLVSQVRRRTRVSESSTRGAHRIWIRFAAETDPSEMTSRMPRQTVGSKHPCPSPAPGTMSDSLRLRIHCTSEFTRPDRMSIMGEARGLVGDAKWVSTSIGLPPFYPPAH
jgi:hypothetical protein